MKKAKKLFSALLAISLALSCALAGCGNKQQSDPGSGPASTTAPGVPIIWKCRPNRPKNWLSRPLFSRMDIQE